MIKGNPAATPEFTNDGANTRDNITAKHIKLFYCHELAWEGVDACDWTDCPYANDCEARK